MADVKVKGDEKRVEENSESEDEDSNTPLGVSVKQLAPVMRGRVRALRNIQLDTVKAEAEYYMEVHHLDVKFQARYDAIHARRAQVVSGAHEPSGAEVEWPSSEEEEDEEEEVDVVAAKVQELSLEFPATAPGVPKFWLHVLKNANEEALLGSIEAHDEPVLEHLADITVTLAADNTGFALVFHFNTNPFFTNQVLTKNYLLRHDPIPEAPLAYDGPEIISCTGCTIDWKAGRDVTKTSLQVTPPRKDMKMKRVKAASFFNFFSPPTVEASEARDCPVSACCLEDDDERARLAMDFEVGFAIKEKVVSKAVLYFTGEIFGNEEEDYETEDEEED